MTWANHPDMGEMAVLNYFRDPAGIFAGKIQHYVKPWSNGFLYPWNQSFES